MAGFPSYSGTRPYDLATAWNVIRNAAGDIKQQSQQLRDLAAANNVPGSRITTWLANMASLQTTLDTMTAVTGMAAYAQAQTNDPTLDIAAAYTAMKNALTAARSWVLANYPKDVNGYLLDTKLNATTGVPEARLFTPAETAGLRTQLDAVIASID